MTHAITQFKSTPYSTPIAWEAKNPTKFSIVSACGDDILLAIFEINLGIIQRAKPLEANQEIVKFLQTLSLTCKTFRNLVCNRLSVKLISTINRINNALRDMHFPHTILNRPSLFEYQHAIQNSYRPHMALQEVWEATKRLSTAPLSQEPSYETLFTPCEESIDYIQMKNLLKVYELLRYAILNASYTSSHSLTFDEIDTEFQAFYSHHKQTVLSLLSDRVFLTIMLRSCPLIPRTILDLIQAEIQKDQRLFDDVLEIAYQLSHPELVNFLQRHQPEETQINKSTILFWMASDVRPRKRLPPGSSLEILLQQLESQEQPFDKKKNTFSFQTNLLLIADRFDRILQQLNKLYPKGIIRKDLSMLAKKEAFLLLTEILYSYNDLGMQEWQNILIICKNLNEEELLLSFLELLSCKYVSLEERENSDVLYSILKEIVRDCILKKDVQMLSVIKRFIPIQTLQEFVSSYKKHYEQTRCADMLDMFESFIQKHVYT